MKTILRCSLATLVLIGLSGCGLKGPLYFPPAEKPAGNSQAAPAKGPTLTTTQTGESVDKNQNISGQ
ncbi:LPS translocon maturation chaperone LptM [Rouxiella sp. Mn2063]|uniref:LPS translocon maturation chaperone LptM n=1 Tax=Rouxiella sp. Mn2063 TaxID=3395262 RepID=UPI003BD7E96C